MENLQPYRRRIETALPPLDVLVVEDDDLGRVALIHLLSRIGLPVRQAGDAEQAMRLCGNRFPDVVLADYNLPGTDGLAFLEWVAGQSADTRCALITAQDRSTFGHALASNIAFFRKPFRFDHVVRFLSSIARDHVHDSES